MNEVTEWERNWIDGWLIPVAEADPRAASIIERMFNMADEAAELQASADLRHKADMRAIERWRAAGGDPLTQPDHADLCVWLMGRIDALEQGLDQCSNCGGFGPCVREDCQGSADLRSHNKELVATLRRVDKQLEDGVVVCSHCGWEEFTRNFDCRDDIAEALATSPPDSEPAEGAGETAAQKANRQAVRENEVLRRAAQQQDAMLERREALEVVRQVIRLLSTIHNHQVDYGGVIYDRRDAPIAIQRALGDLDGILSRTSDEGGVPEPIRQLPALWRWKAKHDRDSASILHGMDEEASIREAEADRSEHHAKELDRAISQSEQQRVPDAEDLARAFHATYETLAPQYGYETREETREFDPDSANGKLMIAVCRVILERMRLGIDAAPQPEHSQPDSEEET